MHPTTHSSHIIWNILFFHILMEVIRKQSWKHLYIFQKSMIESYACSDSCTLYTETFYYLEWSLYIGIAVKWNWTETRSSNLFLQSKQKATILKNKAPMPKAKKENCTDFLLRFSKLASFLSLTPLLTFRFHCYDLLHSHLFTLPYQYCVKLHT